MFQGLSITAGVLVLCSSSSPTRIAREISLVTSSVIMSTFLIIVANVPPLRDPGLLEVLHLEVQLVTDEIDRVNYRQKRASTLVSIEYFQVFFKLNGVDVEGNS